MVDIRMCIEYQILLVELTLLMKLVMLVDISFANCALVIPPSGITMLVATGEAYPGHCECRNKVVRGGFCLGDKPNKT